MEMMADCAFALCALLTGGAYLRQRRRCAQLVQLLAVASEAQRTQDSLLMQRSQLDTIKDEFISTVSHELRTPLTSIRGALGLLSAGLMGSVDTKAGNLLRIAVANTDRLIRLINDILDLERMQSGRAPLYIRRCSLGELAQQALDTMTGMAETADVCLELVVTGNTVCGTESDMLPDLFFDGDPDRILQVLTNLLSNAIKFSPPLSIVRMEIAVNDPGTLELRVRDQGRGIPADKLDTIFDRFGQVEASDARQKGGTGLGLAICRSIVQQHDGTIWAESNVARNLGPGACLVLSIPRLTRGAPVSAFDLTLLPPVKAATILLCDDDLNTRTVVGEHLRRRGYIVIEAASGSQIIERASRSHISAIVLDLDMPGLNGWETLQQLKSVSITSSIPVVILSELAPMRRAGELLGDVKPEGWVTKPFNENVLLAEISRVLNTGEGPAHLLLVEDDHDLADVIIAGFTHAKVRVDHACTSSEAVLHCRLSRPDLLILDLALPDSDGFSLVDWLRQQPDLSSLPLVVYSGREVSDTEMSRLRLGPTQFLTKAKVQPEQVEELVFKMVETLRTPNTSTHLASTAP